MRELQQQAIDIVLADPAVAGVGSSVGGSASSASVNQGRMFISLKPLDERDGIPTARVIERLRDKLAAIAGLRRVLVAGAGHAHRRRARARSQYQFTLWGSGHRRT